MCCSAPDISSPTSSMCHENAEASEPLLKSTSYPAKTTYQTKWCFVDVRWGSLHCSQRTAGSQGGCISCPRTLPCDETVQHPALTRNEGVVCMAFRYLVVPQAVLNGRRSPAWL